MREIWKDIKDYEGLYQVSNLGRVKSLLFGKEKILRPIEHTVGYLEVSLFKDGKVKRFYIHRLVATAFLPNPDNKPVINHKDEVKTNNFVGTPENDYKDGNLEWCDKEYNNNYGTRIERVSKSVLQFSKAGELIREWPSTAECGRNGFNQGHIVLCCNGKEKSHKGYIWKYK
jgi:hypothetical protein